MNVVNPCCIQYCILDRSQIDVSRCALEQGAAAIAEDEVHGANSPAARGARFPGSSISLTASISNCGMKGFERKRAFFAL